MIVDTHVHLNNEDLYENLEFFLEKARNQDVKKMLVVGFTPVTNDLAAKIAESHDGLFATAGLHPSWAEEFQETDFEMLKKQLSHPSIRAVGECGLDFYHGKSSKEKQTILFERQVKLAQEMDLPIVVHMRDASEATYEVLAKHAPIKGVMHCYSGSAEMAEKFLALGMHISLGGPVTFKNAKTPKEVAKKVPLDRLLVETDAPFLAPHPYRGKQNDSSYLPLIVEAIASLRGLTYDEIAETTSANAQKLFRLKE